MLEGIIGSMLAALLAHAYFVLIPLAIIEGPLLAIACGVGAGLGYINPFIAYGILIFGDLLPDAMYYWIGRYGATLPWVRRIASRRKLIRENFLSLEQLWRDHLLATLASVKLAYGIAPPFLVSAGLSAVPFKRFVAASLVVSTIYLGALAVVGYVLARWYGAIDVATGHAAPVVIGVIGFVFVCFLILAMHNARKHLQPQIARAESNLISDQA